MVPVTCIERSYHAPLLFAFLFTDVESLDEFQIRALNDEINALIKEKKAWDFRIRQLGGFRSRLNERFEDIGTEGHMGSEEYYYFGRARELPDVKAWLEKRHAERTGGVYETEDDREKMKVEKRRRQLESKMDAAYYGLHGPVLEGQLLKEDENAVDLVGDVLPGMTSIDGKGDVSMESPFEVPFQADLERMLLERRKARLLSLLHE